MSVVSIALLILIQNKYFMEMSPKERCKRLAKIYKLSASVYN